jgi:hypothetical protein
MSGLLSRWNLRRQKVEDEKLAEEAELVAEQPEIVQEPSVTAPISEQATEQQSDVETEEKLLTAEDLPDPDKIEIGGSFASFMGANVDPLAKAAALKALWKQPQYSEIDGLLEYALDYSNQPKLTPEHSAEIAKKVFRYVTKSDDEKAADEVAELAKAGLDDANLLPDETEDILDGTINEVSQNAQECGDEQQSSVS